jgi:hypothetical protein
MTNDHTYTNGRYELPASARGVYFVPIERRDAGRRPVPITVKSAPQFGRFASFFRRGRFSAS